MPRCPKWKCAARLPEHSCEEWVFLSMPDRPCVDMKAWDSGADQLCRKVSGARWCEVEGHVCVCVCVAVNVLSQKLSV